MRAARDLRCVRRAGFGGQAGNGERRVAHAREQIREAVQHLVHRARDASSVSSPRRRGASDHPAPPSSRPVKESFQVALQLLLACLLFVMSLEIPTARSPAGLVLDRHLGGQVQRPLRGCALVLGHGRTTACPEARSSRSSSRARTRELGRVEIEIGACRRLIGVLRSSASALAGDWMRVSAIPCP